MRTTEFPIQRPGGIFSHGALALAVLTALWSATACGTSQAATPEALVSVAGVTELRNGDAVTGALPMTQSIHVEVALKLRDKEGLDAFVADASRKLASGVMTAPMSSEDFLARHAPTPEQAQSVASYLEAMGFTHVTIAPNRLLVSADGTARTARDAFMTRFAQVRTRDGRIGYANVDEVRVPASLSDRILAVVGLQNVHIAHTFARRADSDGVHTQSIMGHDPTTFPAIYGGAQAATASDVVVGIVTEGSLVQAKKDLATFASNHGLPPVSTVNVDTNGTSGDTAGTNEWDLDSQDIVGMAGQVKQLIFYNIPTLFDSDLTANFNTIVSANKAKIINVSLGGCEADARADGSAAAQDSIFETGVAQGQTFSVSTGDSGADECGDSTNTPSWPASSQYVIAASGTTLNASTSSWSSELVWNDSGGSPSTFEPIPSWQHAFGIAGSRRVAADIAFDGDPSSGALIIFNGKLSQFGGTSLSAPLFSGVWARVLHQYPSIGFAGPVIYGLPAKDFHDVTTGNNSGGEPGIGYTAKVGYDNASGRGSIIIVAAIADAGSAGNKPPTAAFSFATSGLKATFYDKSTDSDGTIASHSWTFGDGGTSTAGTTSHTYAANGIYTVTETVKDNSGASASTSHSVIIGGTQLFVNPGFESGVATPWQIVPSNVLVNNASLAYAGSWLAAIGGVAGTTDHIAQVVTIPASNTKATLSFYLHTTTAETTTTAKPDVLSLRIYNGPTLLATPATYSNLDKSSGYVLHNVDLSAYVGQTIKVQFTGVNSSTLPTTWDLDSLTLTTR